jgi:phosphoenolpyruvate---glycerone phosphotransferase subunit DhaK
MKLGRADEIAEQMVGAILSDHEGRPSGRALLLVNGFGGTPSLELYLMYNAARRILQGRGITVARSLVGSYVTSLEMAGCSVTVTMLDDNLTALWDEPVHTAALRW